MYLFVILSSRPHFTSVALYTDQWVGCGLHLLLTGPLTFTLKFQSHCLLTYIRLLLRWCLKRTWVFKKKTIFVSSFIVILPLATMFFLVSDKKTRKLFCHSPSSCDFKCLRQALPKTDALIYFLYYPLITDVI